MSVCDKLIYKVVVPRASLACHSAISSLSFPLFSVSIIVSLYVAMFIFMHAIEEELPRGNVK